MANEIHVRLRLKYNPSLANSQGFDSGLIEFFSSMTGTEFTGWSIQAAGTTEAALTVSGGIGTQGWVIAKNLDSTNNITIGYADVGTDDDARPITILPGKTVIFYSTGGSALYFRCSAGTPKLQFAIFEV